MLEAPLRRLWMQSRQPMQPVQPIYCSGLCRPCSIGCSAVCRAMQPMQPMQPAEPVALCLCLAYACSGLCSLCSPARYAGPAAAEAVEPAAGHRLKWAMAAASDDESAAVQGAVALGAAVPVCNH